MPAYRLRQAGTVLIGLVVAGVMVWLGLWQLDVYRAQGAATAARRAAEPAVQLTSVAPAGQKVGDAFGRTVIAAGAYDPRLQQLLPIDGSPGRSRVLTGLRQPDGSVVAVVRGVTQASTPPPPPTGPLTQTGIFLPSEDNNDGNGAVRLPLLAQQWTGPLVGGFITLDAAESTGQGLQPPVVQLPDAPGRLRNGAYAMQWWLFAGFALVMTVRAVRETGRAPADEAEAELLDDRAS